MPTALLIYANGSEDLEITAPADILNRGGVKVTKCALTDDGSAKVTLAHGTTVCCDVSIGSCEGDFDIIVVPGGMPGTAHCRDNEKLVALLKAQQAAGRYIAAICAAPGFVLAHHGILTEEKATGYPGCEQEIRNYTGAGVEHARQSRIITAKGPGYAIDFALEILEALTNRENADRVADGLLYSRC